jgi:hypothetical protein
MGVIHPEAGQHLNDLSLLGKLRNGLFTLSRPSLVDRPYHLDRPGPMDGHGQRIFQRLTGFFKKRAKGDDHSSLSQDRDHTIEGGAHCAESSNAESAEGGNEAVTKLIVATPTSEWIASAMPTYRYQSVRASVMRCNTRVR